MTTGRQGGVPHPRNGVNNARKFFHEPDGARNFHKTLDAMLLLSYKIGGSGGRTAQAGEVRLAKKTLLLTYDEFLRDCERSSEAMNDGFFGREEALPKPNRKPSIVGPSQAVYLLPDLRLRDGEPPKAAAPKREIPHQTIDTETWLEKKP